MKKIIGLIFGVMLSLYAIADEWYDESTGFTWYYKISGAAATLTGCSPKEGKLPPLPSMLGGKIVKAIMHSAFRGCSGLTGSLTIPDSVTTIGENAFDGCSGFTGSLTIPDSVTTIGGAAFYDCCGFKGILTIGYSVSSIGQGLGYDAFYGCSGITEVIFRGLPPDGLDGVYRRLTEAPKFLEKYAIEWKKVLVQKNLREPMREGLPVAKVISAKMRENDPTIMDVIYKVTSTKPTVKVRALAFQDGERSFAKVVRPETFVEDENGNPTAGNIGDGVTANEDHTLSWKVSADWNATLAKVKFEVLAVEDEILPLELVTLPKTETQPKMVFSWNYVVSSRAFDSLLWLYADKDLGLTLTDGVLKNGTVRLADGASCDKTSYDALVYIYGKMGYELLQGERLDYVRERSRLDLPGISERQYAVKVIEE